MNYDIIEGLAQEEINALYDDVIENLSWTHYKCYFTEVICSDGQTLNNVYLCTNMMNEITGQYINKYYKNPAFACYEMCDHNYNKELAGCTMTGYLSYTQCSDYRYNQ